jgi:exosome complex component RRP4
MIDVNSYQHAILNLTSINLPGGIQRRRNEEDQMNIRSFFVEGDMISAEIMQVNQNDGKI